MSLSSYEKGLIAGAMYAARPWNDAPMKDYDTATTQDEKDFCLFSCPWTDNCMACEKCDGKGNLRSAVGRPKKNINVTEILILRETLTIAEICHELGVGKMTVYRAIRSMA